MATAKGRRFSRRARRVSSNSYENKGLAGPARPCRRHSCQGAAKALIRAGIHLSVHGRCNQDIVESSRYAPRGALGRAPGFLPRMNRLQFAHLPLRTKLVTASALTASIALLIAALTQGISSYLFSHNEAYEHLHAVARVIAGRSAAAIQS